MSLRRGEGECLYLSLVQGYRWKEIILHSVHRPNNLLKHLLVARVIYHLNLHTNTQLILIRLNSGTMRVWTKNSQSVSCCCLFFSLDNIFLTPTLKRALTGLWSLVFSSMWLRYLSCLTLFPLHRILSHQAGTRHFPLQQTATVSEAKLNRQTRTVLLTRY